MGEYIGAIQEDFRRHGFPIERSGKVQEFLLTASGIQTQEMARWEYRSKDEQWSVLVHQDSMVMQTTAYDRFEDFAEKLQRALDTVLTKTEHDKLGVIQRIGLRYVNVIRPREGEDHRTYLREGFHGIPDAVFVPGTNRLHIESVGSTTAGPDGAKMIVRISQNDEGRELPPDLGISPPKFVKQAQAGETVTLLDLDHFVEGTFEPNPKWVIEQAYDLHDHIIETFHEHVVTPAAIEVWK